MRLRLLPVLLFLSACDPTSPPGDDDTTESPTPPQGEDPPVAVDCAGELATPPAGERCSVSPGSSALLIEGTILTREEVLTGGQVLIDADGRIACVSCDCSGEAAFTGATTLSCGASIVSPGLINAHDHLTFTQNAPADHGEERFEHRHDWRRGQNGHNEINVPGQASDAEISWGELRMVVGGATSVFGSGGASGLLRNLDGDAEGLAGSLADYETFPLGDVNGETETNACSYPTLPAASIIADGAWAPHVAEGIAETARNELRCLSSPAGIDLLGPSTAFIHSVGIVGDDAVRLGVSGTSVIWSPRSNVDLYGNTAPIPMLARAGVNLGLGSDWTASGSMNVLRELACAAHMNRDRWDSVLADWQLWRMATSGGARALGFGEEIGRLAPGLQGDVVVFDGTGHEAAPFSGVVDADVADVVAVLRAGRVLYGDSSLVPSLPGGSSGCESLGDFCTRGRSACLERELGSDWLSLQADNADSYDLFFCDDPPDEPSCDPFRPGEYDGPTTDDADGDGLPNASDLCPSIFDPIRPLDGDGQSDRDQDGLGDACDPCPLDPDTSLCSTPSVDDGDGDGFDDPVDNCPGDPNPDQLDGDNDGHGDACDACPSVPNPGPESCPGTVYAVKQGEIVPGSRVRLEGLVVTATQGLSFWVQVPEADWDKTLGASWSGLSVYVPTTNPSSLPQVAEGDLVTLQGTVGDWFGRIELDEVDEVLIGSSGTPLPTPVTVAPADVKTGGDDADALEAVLVQVEAAAVIELDPPAGPGDSDPTGELVLEGGLRVDDALWIPDPRPWLGDTLEVTGVLRWANADSKVLPRRQDDMQVVATAPPALVGFDEALAWIYLGSVDTTPMPGLTLRINRAAPVGGTEIGLLSGNENSLEAPASVTVPEGMTAVSVPLSGLLVHSGVTLTATLGDDDADVVVEVLDPARIPLVVDLVSDGGLVLIGSTVDYTASLDIPARPGGELLALSLDPGTFATAPVTATVPEGTLSVTFGVGAVAVGLEELCAGTAEGTLCIPVETTDLPPLGLVLSEVFYDADSSDDGLEWVELYNGTAAAIDLSAYALAWGGSDWSTGGLQLSGTIAAHGCFVVGGPTSSADNGNPNITLVEDLDPDLQNSGAQADGVGLFAMVEDDVEGDSVPQDAVIYGGTNDVGLIDETGAAGLVDVADAPAGQSLSRLPEGGWAMDETPGPGDCSGLP